MITNEELLVDKISGFFWKALDLGYDWKDAWDLLLNSEEGQGILNLDYTYLVHHSGGTSAIKANEKLGNNYKKNSNIEVNDIYLFTLLAEFILLAHEQFNIDYKDIFSKMDLNEFMKSFGIALGNYDSKIIKNFLL